MSEDHLIPTEPAPLSEMSEYTCITDTVLGARMSMRGAARHILELLDQLPEHEIAASGWTRDEIASLERIAAMPIAGVPFGDWPALR